MGFGSLQAWANARKTMPAAPPEALDRLIIWRMNDPRYVDRNSKLRNMQMVRQWTIEIRADFSDQDKNVAVTDAVRQVAVMLNAKVLLIKENNQTPQVICYSDDFYIGHEDINLLQDDVSQAIEDDTTPVATVSDEMLQTMRDLQHDKA